MMGDLDPQREWKRLTELYGSLSDDELLRIQEDRQDLTDLAADVLKAEMKRRALAEQLEQADDLPADAPVDPPEDSSEFADPLQDAPEDLVEVGHFRFPSEGALAKAALESAGITSWIFDGTMSKYVGIGVRLAVKPQDGEAARQILSQPIPESFEVQGVGTFRQPRCPKCNSLDISFGPAIYDGMMDRELLPDEQWWCHECGARWEEEQDESDSTHEEEGNPNR